MSYTRRHPDEFPDGPLTSLVRQMGFLLGAPIHYYAAIDLAGFRRMIDLVGGVTVENPRAINDPRYDWLDGNMRFHPAAPASTTSTAGPRSPMCARARAQATTTSIAPGASNRSCWPSANS